jgi:D-alanyl-D-alanine carboxypeptidase/D-alanyl-D-alanine-endopeptidase (penicillin-binding protein 4)
MIQRKQTVVRRRLSVILLAVAACRPAEPGSLVGQPAPRPPSPRLAALIDSITNTRPLERTQWGVYVFDPAKREVVYELNARRHFIPASNMKLVVTSAAMALLGPEWRYRTPVYVVPGNRAEEAEALIVQGRGDPTMSARFFADDFTVLEALVDSVSARGIRRVERLVLDVSHFDSVSVHPTWENGDLRSSDAAPVAAFAVGEGSFRIVHVPGAAGALARARVLAPEGVARVRSEVTTQPGSAPADLDAILVRDTVVVTGTIGAGAPADTEAFALPDPVGHAGRSLSALLAQRGIRVERLEASAQPVPLQAAQLIATWTSPPMSEIVPGMLKPSQNWMDEQLCKTIGAEKAERGSWNVCTRVERRFLIDTVGIDSTAVLLRDASGLAVQNLLTPESIAQLLDWSRKAAWGDAYRAAQAEPGATGTLDNRLLDLRGRLFAKTGSLTNVITLSGYVLNREGNEIIFSIMTNATGQPGSTVRAGVDRIVRAIAELP